MPPPPPHPKSPHLDPLPHHHPELPHLDPPPNRPSRSPPPSPSYTPPPFTLPEPPPSDAPPPPQGASGQQLVGGVVGVQNRGVAPPVLEPKLIHTPSTRWTRGGGRGWFGCRRTMLLHLRWRWTIWSQCLGRKHQIRNGALLVMVTCTQRCRGRGNWMRCCGRASSTCSYRILVWPIAFAQPLLEIW